MKNVLITDKKHGWICMTPDLLQAINNRHKAYNILKKLKLIEALNLYNNQVKVILNTFEETS